MTQKKSIFKSISGLHLYFAAQAFALPHSGIGTTVGDSSVKSPETRPWLNDLQNEANLSVIVNVNGQMTRGESALYKWGGETGDSPYKACTQ